METDRRLSLDGKLLDFPYIVVSIESSPQNGEWFLIPEIQQAYEAVRDAVRAGDIEPVKDLVAVFRRTALTSYDLLPADAQALVQRVKGEVAAALGGVTRTAIAPEARRLPELSEVTLYPQ